MSYFLARELLQKIIIYNKKIYKYMEELQGGKPLTGYVRKRLRRQEFASPPLPPLDLPPLLEKEEGGASSK